MDSKSHMLMGEVLAERLGLPEETAIWATAPDLDWEIGVHRVTYHNLNCMDELYDLGTTSGWPDIEMSDLITMCLSHYWLDMFTAPVMLWWPIPLPVYTHRLVDYVGAWLGLIKERDAAKLLRIYRNLTKGSGDSRFYEKSRTLFKQIPTEFFYVSLRINAIDVPIIRGKIEKMEDKFMECYDYDLIATWDYRYGNLLGSLF